MVLILADNLDKDGRVLSQRIECECETTEEAEQWLREHPHIQGHIVDKKAYWQDILENGIV